MSRLARAKPKATTGRPSHQSGLARLIVTATLLFLPAPIIIVVLASFSANGYLTLPLQSLTLRWYAEFLTSESWLGVLLTSALLAVLAAAGSTVVALLAALAVHRRGFRGLAGRREVSKPPGLRRTFATSAAHARHLHATPGMLPPCRSCCCFWSC